MFRKTTALWAAALLVPATSQAGTFVGASIGLAKDFGDPISAESNTHFGAGPALHVPARVGLGDHAYLRATLRFDSGIGGSDRLTWQQSIDGADVRFFDDDHKAFLLSTGLTVGLDADLTRGTGFTPYVGAEMGVAMINTYHSKLNELVLFDPADVQEGLGDAFVDPYTSQATLLSDLQLRWTYPLPGSLALQIGLGYPFATWARPTSEFHPNGRAAPILRLTAPQIGVGF